jgi:ATP-binding cassette subfamily B protein
MRKIWQERRPPRALLALFVGGCVAANLLSFGWLAHAGDTGQISLAQLAVSATALVGLVQLAVPTSFTDEALAQGASRLPALQRLEALPAAHVVSGTLPATDLPRRQVTFERVSFRYRAGERDVLHELDLELEAGRSLGIVGVNGAGKTTLIKLLARLHDPTSGRITVDGIDLRDIDPSLWQRRVAAIFQDFLRYELTARDNVTLGASQAAADAQALRLAAVDAGADAIIERLPRGWDTVLSRRYVRGVDLSGGQWQRMALARAVYAVHAGAGILVLDEPTANLDVRGEAELFDRFLDVTAGATTVLISHRFSTVRRADRIVVLDGGRIAEQGTHDELLELQGTYARLFSLQAGRYLDPTVTP